MYIKSLAIPRNPLGFLHPEVWRMDDWRGKQAFGPAAYAAWCGAIFSIFLWEPMGFQDLQMEE